MSLFDDAYALPSIDTSASVLSAYGDIAASERARQAHAGFARLDAHALASLELTREALVRQAMARAF
ncbi:MAG: hypothetical protein AAGI34_06460 [Pseudomonadota bacterium]